MTLNSVYTKIRTPSCDGRYRQAAVDVGDDVVPGAEGAASGGARDNGVRTTSNAGRAGHARAGLSDATDGLAIL